MSCDLHHDLGAGGPGPAIVRVYILKGDVDTLAHSAQLAGVFIPN